MINFLLIHPCCLGVKARGKLTTPDHGETLLAGSAEFMDDQESISADDIRTNVRGFSHKWRSSLSPT